MRERILVEFLVSSEEAGQLRSKLQEFEDDLVIIDSRDKFEGENDQFTGVWVRISASISSELLTILKIRDPFIASHMHISYIPDNIKDRYRR